MSRSLILSLLLSTLLGCPTPEEPPTGAPAGPAGPGGPGGDGGGAPAAAEPEGSADGPANPPIDGQPAEESFPEDAPHDFQMVVEGCQDVTIAAGKDPKPAEQRVYTFTVPEGAEILRMEATWSDATRKRVLAGGSGTCPPCEARDRAKGHGSIRLELPLQAPDPGNAWFASMACDPAEDDLSVDTPVLQVQACQIAADGGERGLFPTEGLDQGSQSVLEHDAFGMQGFDGVRTATYQGGKLLAFVAVVGTPEQAQARAKAYHDYLASLGGEEVPVEGLQSAMAMRTYGLTTIIFTRSGYVAGVQEAADTTKATALAIQLADWLIQG